MGRRGSPDKSPDRRTTGINSLLMRPRPAAHVVTDQKRPAGSAPRLSASKAPTVSHEQTGLDGLASEWPGRDGEVRAIVAALPAASD